MGELLHRAGHRALAVAGPLLVAPMREDRVFGGAAVALLALLVLCVLIGR